MGRYPVPLWGVSKMVPLGRKAIFTEQLLQVSLAFHVILTELNNLLKFK